MRIVVALGGNALLRPGELLAEARRIPGVREAVTDIEMIEQLDPATDLGMNLHLRAERPGMLNFKIYRRGSGVPLSRSDRRSSGEFM